MRSITLSALVMVAVAATAAHAADPAEPHAQATHHKAAAKSTAKSKTATAHNKPQPMSDAKRRDLERRIEALEQKSEMQYHEADTPNGAPGAQPDTH